MELTRVLTARLERDDIEIFHAWTGAEAIKLSKVVPQGREDGRLGGRNNSDGRPPS